MIQPDTKQRLRTILNIAQTTQELFNLKNIQSLITFQATLESRMVRRILKSAGQIPEFVHSPIFFILFRVTEVQALIGEFIEGDSGMKNLRAHRRKVNLQVRGYISKFS